MEAQTMISELESSTIKVILWNVIRDCTFRNQLNFILRVHSLLIGQQISIKMCCNCCSFTYLRFQQDEINSPAINLLDLSF
jgi:hypothetical protein